MAPRKSSKKPVKKNSTLTSPEEHLNSKSLAGEVGTRSDRRTPKSRMVERIKLNTKTSVSKKNKRADILQIKIKGSVTHASKKIKQQAKLSPKTKAKDGVTYASKKSNREVKTSSKSKGTDKVTYAKKSNRQEKLSSKAKATDSVTYTSKKSNQQAKLSPQTKGKNSSNWKETVHGEASNLLLLAKLSDEIERVGEARQRRAVKCPAWFEKYIIKKRKSMKSKGASIREASLSDDKIALSPNSKRSLKRTKKDDTNVSPDDVTPACSKAKNARKSAIPEVDPQSKTKGKEIKYAKGPVVIIAGRNSVSKKQISIEKDSTPEVVSKDVISVYCSIDASYQTDQDKDVTKKPDFVVHSLPPVRKAEVNPSKTQHVVKVIADKNLIRTPETTTIKKVTLPKFDSYTNACVVQVEGKTFVVKAPPGQGQLTPKRIVYELLPYVKDKRTALKDVIVREIKATDSSKSNKTQQRSQESGSEPSSQKFGNGPSFQEPGNGPPSQKSGNEPPETEAMTGIEALLKASELTSTIDMMPSQSSTNPGKCYITYPVYNGTTTVSYTTVRMSDRDTLEISKTLNIFTKKAPKQSDRKGHCKMDESSKPQKDESSKPQKDESSQPQKDESSKQQKDNDKRAVTDSVSAAGAKNTTDDSPAKISQNTESGNATVLEDHYKQAPKTIKVDDPQNWQQFVYVNEELVPSFPCDRCNKKFPSRVKLKWHLKKEHQYKLQQWYRCSDCEQQFVTKHLLKTHLLLAHKISKDLLKSTTTCTTENNASGLPVHQPDNCNKCSSCKLVLPSAQKMHDSFDRNKVVISDLILCEPCDEAFMNVKEFLLHKRDVHNLAPNMSRIRPNRTVQLGDDSTQSSGLSTNSNEAVDNTERSSSISWMTHTEKEQEVGNSQSDDDIIEPIQSVDTDVCKKDSSVSQADSPRSDQALENDVCKKDSSVSQADSPSSDQALENDVCKKDSSVSQAESLRSDQSLENEVQTTDVPLSSDAVMKDVYSELENISKDDLPTLLVASKNSSTTVHEEDSDVADITNSVRKHCEISSFEKLDKNISETSVSASDKVSGDVANSEQNLSQDANKTASKLFYCDVCDKHIRNLQAHILFHTDEKPFKCASCSLAFRSNACLKVHQKRHSKQQVKFSCSVCERKFMVESNLERHVAECRTKPFRCKKCPKAYSLTEDLEIHLKVHKKDPFTCDECGQSFLTVARLDLHVNKNAHPAIIAALDMMERHLVEPQVNSNFETKPDNPEGINPLHSFVKSSTDVSDDNFYRCKICDQVGGSLRMHMMIHITETPIKCQECDKGFKTQCALKNHMFIHQKTSWHQCPYCENKYRYSQCLERHIVSHTGVYPHICSVCEKGFLHVEDYHIHVSSHEGYEDKRPPLMAPAFRLNDTMFKLNPNINQVTCGCSADNVNQQSGPFVCSNCNVKFKNVKELASHKVYECCFCGKIAKNSCTILSHFKDHSEDSPYKCNLCDSTFKTSSLLRTHRVTHKESALTCPHCSKVFKFQVRLDKHMRSHSDVRPYQCELCPKTYRYKGDLARHAEIHMQTKPYSCYVCGKTYPTETRLRAHCRWSHEKKKKSKEDGKLYVCNVCGQNSASLTLLKSHVTIHTGEKPFECEICGVHFRTKSILYGHMRSHSDSRPYKCKLCPKQYKTSGSLRVHQWDHTGVKPYPCKICGKSYPHLNKLYQHMRSHTGEVPYQCHICYKRFAAKGELKLHQRVHTGERKYSCNYCDRSFAQRTNLIIHNRIHTGERPYKCDFCDSSFRVSSVLKSHIRTHTGERPFTCDICPNAYAARKLLQSHMKTHDDHKPYSCKRCHKLFVLKSNLDNHYQIHKKEEDEARNLLQSDLQLKVQLKHVSDHVVSKSRKPLTETISMVETSLPPTCPSCSRIFATTNELNIHKKSHLLKPFQCAVCAETFSSPDLLSSHLLKHVESESYKCLQCGQDFADEMMLKIHSSTHSNQQDDEAFGRVSKTPRPGGKKEFKCNVCKKSFHVKSLLTAHNKIHIPCKEQIVETCVLDGFGTNDSQPMSSVIEKMFMNDPNQDGSSGTNQAASVVLVECKDADLIEGKDGANEGMYFGENNQDSIVIQQGVSDLDQQPYITIEVPPEYNQNINELISQASSYLDTLT